MEPSFLIRALDAAAAGTMITDRSGTIEWVSSAFTRITGFEASEAVGKTPRILKSAMHTTSFYSQLWQTIASGRPWRGTIVNRHKNGSTYSALESISPILDERGEVTHFIAMLEQGGAGQVLQESEDRYYALVESLGDGVLSATADGRILMANPAAARVLGVPRDMLLGRQLNDIAHPDDLKLLEAESKRRKHGERSVYEFRVVRPDDGAVRTIQVTATPLMDAQKHFQGSLGIFRDVTADRQMQQRVRLLAHTLESVDEAVVICGADDRIVFVNRSFQRTYGYDERELVGQPIGKVRSPLTPPEAVAAILPATLAGGWRGEVWNRRKDGSDFLILLTTAAVMDDSGRLEATVGVVRDITEQRRFEAELKRAKEQAERANKAKSEFLATISHEIRTPMNGVIGMTSVLLETELNETQREFAEIVRKSADVLLSIINDILDFSRLEAGKMPIESLPFDLGAIASEVRDMLARKAGSSGVSLSIEYPADVPRRFVGDGGRIRQVLMNLVSNALKFTPSGGVRIEVECEGVESSQAEMRVSVHDTGVGIPEDKLDLIFDKFSQVDSSNTRRYGGTGLGLAIVKELVDLMNGTVGVKSQPGEGSTFWFTLPLSVDCTRTPAKAERVTGVASRPGTLPRVLLAEDNPDNREVASAMLRRLGFGTDVAADGREAVEKCARGQYDLVLMDCQMPEMDGYDATGELRRREGRGRRVPIIAHTANAREGTRERCLAAGMDDYLVKPVKLDDLRSVLRKWAPGPA
jgi:PAS domain S-box-containing protein